MDAVQEARRAAEESWQRVAALLVPDACWRFVVRVLRHADLSVTMEIYAKASSAATADALRRLGDSLE